MARIAAAPPVATAVVEGVDRIDVTCEKTLDGCAFVRIRGLGGQLDVMSQLTLRTLIAQLRAALSSAFPTRSGVTSSDAQGCRTRR